MSRATFRVGVGDFAPNSIQLRRHTFALTNLLRFSATFAVLISFVRNGINVFKCNNGRSLFENYAVVIVS